MELLLKTPLWRLSWCDDPRARQLLAGKMLGRGRFELVHHQRWWCAGPLTRPDCTDPTFVAMNQDTLTDLTSIPLERGARAPASAIPARPPAVVLFACPLTHPLPPFPDLDLSPFLRLQSVLLLVKGAGQEYAPLLQCLPSSVEHLHLTCGERLSPAAAPPPDFHAGKQERPQCVRCICAASASSPTCPLRAWSQRVCATWGACESFRCLASVPTT